MRRCAILLLVACGRGGGGAAPDAAAPDAACSPNGSTNPYLGQIVLTATADNTFAVTAAFTDQPACITDHPCTISMDRCCYMASPPVAPELTPVSAGVLTIPAAQVTMTPTGATYAPVTNPPTTSLTWTGESNVVIDAAGDVVHAFETQVTAAGVPTGINPAITSISIPRANNFDVSWQQGNGLVTLALTSSHGTITCSAYPDNGNMDVPAALLANFAAADTGTISITREYSVVDSPDNADVLTVADGVASGTASYP
jgi:hypothetical protein